MATTAHGRAPAHLWIVGILALLWNGYACFEYLMTMTANEEFMSKVPADQIAYMNSLPSWLTAFWAIGVWGGLAGALLLLMRSRYSVWAFALSLIGAVVGLGYQMFATARPASMTGGAMAIVPWVIILVAAFLAWYSWTEEKKGDLR
jgi:hypothetical protein